MNKKFSDKAWEEYKGWIEQDKSVWKKINSLIKEIERTPFEGLGKPEPLRHALSGYWSRRITGEHRLIYRVDEDDIHIIACKEHYK